MRLKPKLEAYDILKIALALLLIIALCSCSTNPHKDHMQRMEDSAPFEIEIEDVDDPLETLIAHCEYEYQTRCVGIVISLKVLTAAMKAYDLQKKSI